jgi:hypothetical protein
LHLASDFVKSLAQGSVSGFAESRLKNSDILLDRTAANANASDELALAAERRSSSHHTVFPLRHQRKERLARLRKRKKVGRSHPHERGRISLSLGDLDRESRRSVHAVMEDDISVYVDHANRDRNFGTRRFCLYALCDSFREGEQIHDLRPFNLPGKGYGDQSRAAWLRGYLAAEAAQI